MYFEELCENSLMQINGGTDEDYEFGQFVGKAAAIVWFLNPPVLVFTSNYLFFNAIFN